MIKRNTRQHGPFDNGANDDVFFAQSSRGQRLNLLLSMAPYSDVAMISGAQGYGKTSLLRQFIKKASDSWRVCLIDADANTDVARVMTTICRTFAPELEIDSDSESNRQALCKSLHQLRHDAIIPMLLVDDADLLSTEIWQLIMQLVDAKSDKDHVLNVILCCDPGREGSQLGQEWQQLRAYVTHRFELHPLTEEETSDYIRHRLAVAGDMSADVFTPDVLKVIYAKSNGIPGKINELARLVLQNSNAAHKESTGWSIPLSLKQHLPVTLIVVTVIALGLFFQDSINELFVSSDQSANHILETAPLPEPSTIGLLEPAKESDTLSEAPSSEMAMETNNILSAQESLAAQESPVMKPVVEPVMDAAPEQIEVATKAAEESQEIIPEEIQEDASIVSPAMMLAETERDNTHMMETESSLIGSAESESEPSASGQEILSAAATGSAIPATLIDQHRAWIQDQAAEDFTLQLIALDNEAAIKRYIATRNIEDAVYFRTPRRNEIWFAIVQGVYKSHDEARDAANSLIKEKKIKPWIRDFASIQQAMQTVERQ